MASQYPNIKIALIDKIFGPLMDYLDSKGICGGFIFVVLFGIFIYFDIFYKRPRGKKLDIMEKITIVFWFLVLIGNLGIQIIMLTKPWEK